MRTGLKRPNIWPKVEKESDMIEILYVKVFGVAEFENEGKSKKFQISGSKMADSFIKKLLDINVNLYTRIFGSTNIRLTNSKQFSQ